MSVIVVDSDLENFLPMNQPAWFMNGDVTVMLPNGEKDILVGDCSRAAVRATTPLDIAYGVIKKTRIFQGTKLIMPVVGTMSESAYDAMCVVRQGLFDLTGLPVEIIVDGSVIDTVSHADGTEVPLPTLVKDSARAYALAYMLRLGER